MEITITLPDGTKIEIKGAGAVDAAARLIDPSKQTTNGKLDLVKLLQGAGKTAEPVQIPGGIGQQYPGQQYYQHGSGCSCFMCRTGTWCGASGSVSMTQQYQCAAQ